jgi:hypothetical protein
MRGVTYVGVLLTLNYGIFGLGVFMNGYYFFSVAASFFVCCLPDIDPVYSTTGCQLYLHYVGIITGFVRGSVPSRSQEYQTISTFQMCL